MAAACKPLPSLAWSLNPVAMADALKAEPGAVAPPEPVTIHRADYQPPDWFVDTVQLSFDLSVRETRVSAALSVRRNGAHNRPLALDEDGTLPQDLTVDGDAVAWTHEGNSIIVPISGDAAKVAFTTTLDPSSNSQLMGLFASNGILCTQCEAQGFRRIIPFVDRPDNMSIYTVRLEADKTQFPILLANGEQTDGGDMPGPNGDQRHYAVWHDPWQKPSYLFALVAGDLVANRDHFTTMSGKAVDLAIWVRDGDQARTHHAMTALKNSMAWDERVYGREYDLSVFNIVAVSDFNMGAMENKGLNIFNTRYILADPETATDLDFDGVEGVVAHEYFHNWSGNRVTCRDWFQLSLKEGFTVYRDQCFSADMGSAAVKRIEDVRMLRAAQFPEDAGPLAHPIRPDSYQEISNFYTATVYNKGAEIIRMIATMAGPEQFRHGTDLYFARHDGDAATCEDFICAMEESTDIDLTQFRTWYSQAGTPRVSARIDHDAASGAAILHLAQSTPPTPGQSGKAPQVLPLRIAAHDRAANAPAEEQLVLLSEAAVSMPLGNFTTSPMLSFNRGFSAPIIAEINRAPDELAWLAAHDDDPFARYEAVQQLMIDTLVARVAGAVADTAPVITAIAAMLANAEADPAFVAEASVLPTEAFLGDQMLIVDPDAIRRERRALQQTIGIALADDLRRLHAASVTDAADLSPAAKGWRKLRNAALGYIMASGDNDGPALALAQFKAAGGMTDRQSALAWLSHSDAPERDTALTAFYGRFHHDPLVLDKWFSVQAFSMRADTPHIVEQLAQHGDFTLSNPNRVRSLYGAFSGNQGSFHGADGRGYQMLADLIVALDPKNPQTAARMIPPLGRWKRFDEGRAAKMRSALNVILATPGLSRDSTEQAAKSLHG
jgi:aminopeptidase N